MALSPSQQLTLRTNIQANTTVLAFSGGNAQINTVFAGTLSTADAQIIADHYNSFGPANTHTVWKSSISKNEVGKAFEASALAAITAGNNDKLSCFAAWNDTVYPFRLDQRQFFDDIFSVAAGANTRAALLVLWKRVCRVVEKVFATGTGSDASPATLVYEGVVNGGDEISHIKGLPA